MPSRRDFLRAAAATAAGAAGLLTSSEDGAARTTRTARLDRLGVELFTVPKLLERDFAGTMKLIAEFGYKEVEFYGPYSFSLPAAQERWKALGPSLGFTGSGFFGRTPKQVREILDRHGLAAPAMHVDLGTLRTRLNEVGEAAHVLGVRYAGISSIPQENRRTLDDYKRIADEFNEIGRRAAPLGFQFLYHNHGYGQHEMDGQIPFKVVLERTDPKLVTMEMDIYWTVAGGGDPVAYLDAYPNHFRLMHVKDMAKRVRFSGDGGDPSQWEALFPYMTTAGSGVLDLRAILSHATRSGVQHFLVEQDRAPNAAQALRKSYRYLSTLQLAS
jgi:sugar phosphate isomerase/epimerase